MFGMLVIIGFIALVMVSAIIKDMRQFKREYKRINAELERCNQLIHGYNGRG